MKLTLISFLLANLLVDQVFEKMILANIPIAALFLLSLPDFIGKGQIAWGPWSVWWLVLSLYLFFGETGGYTWYWAVFGISIIFITGTAVSLLYNNKFVFSELYAQID